MEVAGQPNRRQWADDLRALLGEDLFAGARALLGCRLVSGVLSARIVEVEAYSQEDDPGSHAHRGPTPRNGTMFGEPGRAYVYFTYGMHWMLNVSARPLGQGSAILIRAAEPLEGLPTMHARRPKAVRDEDLLNGPAKLAQAFGVTRNLDGLDLLDPKSVLRLEPGDPVREVLCGPRIGMSPGKGEHLPWRFVDARALRWVSRPHSTLSPLRAVN